MFVCLFVCHYPAVLVGAESYLKKQVDHLYWSTAIIVGAECDESAALISIGAMNITALLGGEKRQYQLTRLLCVAPPSCPKKQKEKWKIHRAY